MERAPVDGTNLSWSSSEEQVFAIQCLISSICSPLRTCEHINIQTYRHLNIYGGGQPITGEPGPGTGCDGHAVSVRFILLGFAGFQLVQLSGPPISL